MNTTKYDGNKVVAWSECDWKPRELAVPNVKPTKLSEAIRIGAKIRPQIGPEGLCGPFSRGGSCALGAAYEGLGYEYSPDAGTSMVISILDKHGMPASKFASEIITRNDFSHYSREQIADWLEAQGF